jgi:aminopeptidase N
MMKKLMGEEKMKRGIKKYMKVKKFRNDSKDEMWEKMK